MINSILIRILIKSYRPYLMENENFSIILRDQMSNFEKLLLTLKFIVETGKNLLEDNNAYKIYRDLLSAISKYDTIEHYFDDHPDIRRQHEEFLQFISMSPNYNNDRITACNILGDLLQDILKPRFTKESKRDPNTTREQHTINWFKINSSLDYVIDKTDIQAAFITLFFI